MNLNTKERLILVATLPKEGDFTTLKIVRQLREDLSFSEDEHARLHFVNTPEGVQWQQGGDQPREFAIGAKAKEIIVAALQQLNDAKRLTADHLSLYEKFVGDDDA